MIKDGKYIYCIIAADCDSRFGTIGVCGSGDLVYTIGFNGLAMVVSNHPLSEFVVSPENILAHQKVIERVMEEYNSVLPVRYGTVAASQDEIINLLERRYREFSDLLWFFEDKVELNITASWKHMDKIFREIEKENVAFKKIRKEVDHLQNVDERKKKMTEAGIMVEKALLKKKESESERIIDVFRRIVFEYKQDKTTNDAMFMNTAFMVTKGREKEFDYLMDDLGEQYEDRIDFRYTGPMPVYDFIDLQVQPEEWEV